jgi:hypothetical protein
MKRDHGDNTGRIGVYAVAAMIEKELGWIFREQPTSDHGIDAQVEVVGSRSDVTGRLIALQIKSGKSYFRRASRVGSCTVVIRTTSTIGLDIRCQ